MPSEMSLPLFIAALLGVFPLPGQSPEPIERDPAGVALLERAAAAMGAEPGLVRSVFAKGRLIDRRAPGRPDIAFQILGDGAGRVRWEFESTQGLAVSVVEGNSGFVQRSGTQRPVGLNAAAGRGAEALPALALGEWISSPAARVSPLDPLQDGERTLERVEVSRSLPGPLDRRRRAVERASRLELCLSSESGLPERLVYFLHPGDWRTDVPVELRFGDYRQAAQTLWPFRVEVHRAGALAFEYAFEEVRLNVEVDEEAFRP